MGNCISCAKRKREPKREITLALLGLDNAGKSTTTKGLLGETLETIPTIGFNVEDIKFGDYDLKMYDLGGGKKIRDIWVQYFSEVYGIVYVVDSTATDRMEEIKHNLQNLLEHPKVSGKPLLLLANKQDKENAMDELDICEQLNLEQNVNRQKCPCRIETCSAIKGTGRKMDKSIKSGLQWLCGMIDHNWTTYKARIDEDVAEQEKIRKREMEERRERVRKMREERERKEKEENERLGIHEEEDAEEEIDISKGGPFQRLDINELTKKEKKLKDEKKRRKELEKQQKTLSNQIDKEDSEAEKLGELRAPRSARSIDRFGLFNDNSNSTIRNDQSDESDNDDTDFHFTPRNRKATPRLPPLQKPLGTKFNEDAPVEKAKKKKKKKMKLKALKENTEEFMEDSDEQYNHSKKSLQSISKIHVDSMLSNGYSKFDTLESDFQRRSYKIDNDGYEEEEYSPRHKSKKAKRKLKKQDHVNDGYGYDLSTPRTLGNIENESDQEEVTPRKFHSNDSDDNKTEIRKLKKKKPKHFLKKNKTAPSDDEYEMNDREVSFSPAGSPKKKMGYTPRQDSLTDMFSAKNWGLAEDLPDVETDYKPMHIRRRANVDEDDDIIF